MELAAEKKDKMGTDGLNEEFRDKLSTVDERGKRKWLFPIQPKGRLTNLRKQITWIYLLVFFGLPFIKVNGDPLFLFNIVERKFILFGIIFWPQDFFIFGLGMVIFIVFVALFTVVFGRVFCGWACPQTLFMEMVFRRLEYMIEGSAGEQKALERMSWTFEKIRKKTLKYFSFIIISFLIAMALLAYILSVDTIIKVFTGPASLHTGAITALSAISAIIFFIYTRFREQVCLIVCPYGRMQGVLLDKNSIVVAYDYVRGEPRHKYRKKEENTRGDCVDCALCVKVCPTGIDIRNGTQLECINCTACIDECDHMMESIGRPKGLIRYDSEAGIKEKKKLKITGRIKAYSLVLLALIGLEAIILVGRSDVDATVLRAKGLLYQEQPDNMISNLYTIKLINKTRNDLPLTIKIENYPAEIKLVGKPLRVKREGVMQGEFFVFLAREHLKFRKTKLEIGLYSGDKKLKTIKTNFLGPVNSRQ
jgi:cytochrome c oxidase accessory protein FixG